MTKQQSEIDECPTCGTARITFVPPLVFEVSKQCGQIKPGNWSTGDVPVCERPKGHDGVHVCEVEMLETWPQGGST